MNRVFKLFYLLPLLFITSCDDGLYCTSSQPTCCFDVIFGCGPFDLPFGCTCDDYGFRSQRSEPVKAKLLVNSSLNNLWSGKLNKVRSSCSALKQSINGNVQILQKKNLITINVPTFGKLRGKKNKNLFTATGFYNLGEGCSARVVSKGARQSIKRYKVRTVLSYSCRGRSICQASYAGRFSR